MDAVRSGDTQAFGELYTRHRRTAFSLALQFGISRAMAEDVVAEAFTKVLAVLLGGGGPTKNFRSYLLSAVHTSMCKAVRHDRPRDLTDHPELVKDSPATGDATQELLEGIVLARALASLPARWRSVLWFIEVDGYTAASLAATLGTTPNGVAALSYRAREGLRAAYLQAHLNEGGALECRPFVDRLGDWLRHRLPVDNDEDVGRHVRSCRACAYASRELGDLIVRLEVSCRQERSPLHVITSNGTCRPGLRSSWP